MKRGKRILTPFAGAYIKRRTAGFVPSRPMIATPIRATIFTEQRISDFGCFRLKING
jgi:hypothetical protein